MSSGDLLRYMLMDPSKARDHIHKLQAERSMRKFVEYVWPVMEPKVDYVESYSTAAICEHLEAVSRGEMRKLIINIPPGLMKSFLVNIAWGAYEWGPLNMPQERYICCTYAEGLTTRMALRSRNLLKSELYQKAWGKHFTFRVDQDNKLLFVNDKSGYRLSTSVGGTITGDRGTRLICDDLHAVNKAESQADRDKVVLFFFEVLPTRMVDPRNPVTVLIMQRVHEADITGEILAREGGGDWEHLRLPMRFEADCISYGSQPMKYMKEAKGEMPEPEYCVYNRRVDRWMNQEEYALVKADNDKPIEDLPKKVLYKTDWRTLEGELLSPDFFTEAAVAELTERLGGEGSYAVAGQLQQRPVGRGGGMFPTQWTVLDAVPDFKYAVRGWDLACSTRKESPYTAGVKLLLLNDGRIMVAHLARFRAEPQAMYARLENVCRADDFRVVQDFPQDPGQAGKAQRAYLASLLHGVKFTSSMESGDKETRAMAFASQVEAGNVVLLRGDWNNQFIDEMSKFPRSKFKDIPDACSRAYNKLFTLIKSASYLSYHIPEEGAGAVYRYWT